MCGIAGVIGDFSREEGERTAARMNAALSHRGPDDAGLFATDGFAFAIRRLSILDLETGNQPIWTEAGRGIVFNGEIYNHAALRDALSERGVRFRTRSDTEVVLRLHEAEGPAGLDRLGGMFAYAIFDPVADEVHLVRDRIGIKPFYYAERAGRFFFASEIKAILAGLDARPPLDLAAIHHYLTLRYVPSPETIWEGIRKLPPGHRIVYDRKTGTWRLHRWWRLRFASEAFDPARDYVGEFEELFAGAVESHLTSADVPVGVLLSGGIDSSAVAAAAAARGHRDYHTFTVAFEDGGEYDETAYAREAAARARTVHRQVRIGKREFLETLPALVRFSDEPLADLASVPLYHVARLARESVKVVLTGEGSDEILAGYDFERLMRRLDALRPLDVLPGGLLQIAGRILPGRAGAYLGAMGAAGWRGALREVAPHMTRVWEEEEKNRLWRRRPDAPPTEARIRALYREAESDHPLDQMQEVYVRSWLVEDLLMKADKMTMAHSLEARVPYLDHTLVEWAARLPVKWKVGDRASGYASKRILRAFAAERIPASILRRPKRGFPVPAVRWLREDLGDWAEDRLLRRPRFLPEIFETAPVGPVLAAARGGDGRAAEKVWALLILEEWGREWMAA